ncbi:MAG TPA: hypothetical protein VFS94_09960 [Gemmatimonadales bacterium]|nr:hypothetical protein [Gemmatimonadales bacterium]
MNELWNRLLVGLGEIGSVLPAFLAAGLILLTGYVLARQVQRWVDDLLKRADFNRMAAAGGLDEVVTRTGSRLDPVRALAKLVFWLVMLVVILLASTALGLESINEMFGIMLGYIPTLISAIVIVILGMIVGEFVRAVVLASAGTVAGVPTLAKLAKGAVILIAVFMALQQIGVAEEIVTSAFTLILGAVALAAGLAFGLGNRELAGEVTRRWYEAGQRRDRRRTDRPGPNTPPDGSPPMMD